MKYKNPIIKEIALKIPILCGLLFAVYCFVFLYRSQSYVQAVAQRMASPDADTFNPLFSASFCTILLLLTGILLQRAMRWLPLRLLALPWFIPFMIFALLSRWHYPELGDVQLPCGWGFYFFIILVYFVLLFISRIYEDSSSENKSFSAYTWPNLLLMLFFMASATRISNTDRILYQTLQSNRCLQTRDYDGILDMCKAKMEMSHSQAAMLALALDKTGQMGDHLFHYTHPWGSDGLLPLPGDSVLQVNTSKLQGHNLGYIRGEHLTTVEFLEITEDMPNIKSTAQDYQLCGYLLDRRLDKFMRLLLSHTDSLTTDLPMHYREAIQLYQHTRTNPITHFQDAAVEENLMDFLRTKNNGADERQRKLMCREMYADTYWYYYFWSQKKPLSN